MEVLDRLDPGRGIWKSGKSVSRLRYDQEFGPYLGRTNTALVLTVTTRRGAAKRAHDFERKAWVVAIMEVGPVALGHMDIA